ncbi:MAG: phosphoribosylformylglycinamidine synthase [Phycisphaerae bacterium]|nr:phosphoribosylformylglycinamidine synthase [Phycisphaerae bacterium]
MPRAAAEPVTDQVTDTIICRIEVRQSPGSADAAGEAVARSSADLDVSLVPSRVEHAWIYLVQGRLDQEMIERIAMELLADPVTQYPVISLAPAECVQPEPGVTTIEVHPLPGVTDPAAQSVMQVIGSMLDVDVQVRTGHRWDLHGVDDLAASRIAETLLANPVIHDIHDQPFFPESFPKGTTRQQATREIPIRDLDDGQLEELSRNAHLFLDLQEMKCIQDQYRSLQREPREIELETLAQTWSEHCVHKTLKSTIRYTQQQGDDDPASIIDASRPGHVVEADGSVTIENLLKSTVAAATHELIEDGIDWCLSVFVDNAGVIGFDEEWGVCFKCETHNHPSALEPYGGAATGIGGCIRDIMGTGRAARPIASTDVFCVGSPYLDSIPQGCLWPRRILSNVVAGVRDYGNRMGIPTLNGTVWFDDRYVGNPLVFCGCIGLIPREFVEGEPRAGDRIIAIGGRTGRDGIHGATFSSAELTDSHADEFSHAVQIGNAITEKKALDAIIAARDHEDGCLFSAITDCGAGGFSSAVGEMGETLGARVDLENAPLKYRGLTPTEVWISEAQERMVLAVSPEHVDTIASICLDHEVEWCDLGEFGTPGRELVLRWEGQEIGCLPMSFLHDGIPTPVRQAEWPPRTLPASTMIQGIEPIDVSTGRNAIESVLLSLLSHPNIASKEWIIRQYDHEVQGGSVIKPLVGPGAGPSDAAVIRPLAESDQGLAIANGLATGLASDPYLMGLAAIDECVRNLVCVGCDPDRIAILDNFCWPGCRDSESLGGLVRAAEACYDGAKAYRAPFISGKDSLNNQFTTDQGVTIRIPSTLLISGMGIVPRLDHCITMDAKSADNLLVMVGSTSGRMGGSVFSSVSPTDDDRLPMVDLQRGPRTAAAVAGLIANRLVRSAHDCSEGGLAVAVAEMCLAGGIGCRIELDTVPVTEDGLDPMTIAFSEEPSRYMLEIQPGDLDAVTDALEGLPWAVVGRFTDQPRLDLLVDSGSEPGSVTIEQMHRAWSGSHQF